MIRPSIFDQTLAGMMLRSRLRVAGLVAQLLGCCHIDAPCRAWRQKVVMGKRSMNPTFKALS